jgi:TP901 family phage tail tape measure protein
MNLGTMYATLGIKTTGFTKAKVMMGSLQDSTKKVTDQLRTQGKQLQVNAERMMRLGYYTSMYLTLPILGAGVATLAFQKRFGATMNRVENMIEVSREKTNKWREEIMDLAPKTGQGPFALARALEIVQQEGVNASEAMQVVEKAAIAASVTGSRQLSILAQAVANVSSGLQVAPQEAAGFVARLVGKEGVMPMRVGTMFGEIAANARVLGVGLRDLGAAFGVVNDAGSLSWRIAGRLDNVFSDLLATSGSVAQQLRDVLRDDGLVVFLETIKEIEKTKPGVIAQIFSKNSLKILRNLVNNLPIIRKEYDSWSISANYLNEKLKGVNDTVQFQYKIALATLESTFVKLGQVLKSKMIGFLQEVNKQLQQFTSWVRSLSQEQINQIISIAKWVAAIGPLLMVLGLLGSLVGNVLSLIARLLPIITKAAWVIHPLVMAVSGLVVGLISLHNKFADTEDKITSFMGILKKTALILTKTFGGALVYLAYKQVILKFIPAFKKATVALKTFRGALVAASTAAKALGRALLYYLIIETIIELNKQFKSVSKTIKESLATWGHWFQYMLYRLNPLIETMRLLSKVGIGSVKGLDSFAEYTRNLGEAAEEAAKDVTLSYYQIVSMTQAVFQSIYKVKKDLEPVTLSNLFDFTGKDADKAMTPLEEALHQHTISIESARRMLDLLGEDYDFINEAAGIYKRTLESLVELQSRGTNVNEHLIKSVRDAARFFGRLADEQGKTREETEKQIGPMAELSRNLDIIAMKEKYLGKQYDDTRAKLQAYQQAFNKLVELSQDQELTTSQSKALDEYANKIIEIQEKLSKTTEYVLTWADVWNRAANQIGRSMADVASMLGEQLAGSENAMQSFVTTVLQGMLQVTQAMLAEAMAAMIAGEAIKGGLVGALFAATVGVSALLAAWQRTVGAQVEKAQNVRNVGAKQLSSGGRIPPGFPNDTYPALLSSGETVVPDPESLDSDMLAGNMHVTIEGRTHGEEIYYALREYMRQKGTTF